jgi:hypothetical protein
MTQRRQLHRMFLNRKRRNDMKRMFLTFKGWISEPGCHLSIYNVMGYVEKRKWQPPYQFTLSPIDYDKLWRNQRNGNKK